MYFGVCFPSIQRPGYSFYPPKVRPVELDRWSPFFPHPRHPLSLGRWGIIQIKRRRVICAKNRLSLIRIHHKTLFTGLTSLGGFAAGGPGLDCACLWGWGATPPNTLLDYQMLVIGTCRYCKPALRVPGNVQSGTIELVLRLVFAMYYSFR